MDNQEILQALELAAVDNNSQIQSMKVVLDKGNNADTEVTKAYFLSNEAIKFRHEGEIDSIPPELYLADVTNHGHTILVYYSASGSGKTSELVGSSASRGAHLAIVATVDDPTDKQYDQFESDAVRNVPRNGMGSVGVMTTEMTSPCSQESGLGADSIYEKNLDRFVNKAAADQAILPGLVSLIESAKTHLLSVVQAAEDSKQPLKLVLAIDEASSCPRVIRGVLRFPEHIKSVVEDAIFRGLDHSCTVDLKISIAGTGVASSTIGSLPGNFLTTGPYHEDHYEQVINHNLREEPLELTVPWSTEIERILSFTTIETNLPVVAKLMENGRLASITLAVLRKYGTDKIELKEGKLVNDIVWLFMKSNGMHSLLGNKKLKQIVAASALAVHLFSEREDFQVQVPQSSPDVAAWAQEMNFFSFATKECCVRDLVKKYGLLEPSTPVEKGHRGLMINPPVKMTTPQQLVAAFMLGLDLDSMLEPTWFGFELMSTHFVKCALAASAAVCFEKRPPVADTLALLGFGLDPIATTTSVRDTWTKLEDWVAVFTDEDGYNDYFFSTRQVKVGLKIVEAENEPNFELLQIEKKLKDAIMKATPLVRTDSVPPVGSVPPIACINEGNSDLCDGIVTFWAMHKTGRFAEKLSIMVQAKDYHDTSTLDVHKLNKHAQTMSNKVLDGVFGKQRLLCVASTSASLLATSQVSIEREFLPFVFNMGNLLSQLLSQLKSQRFQSNRIAKYACFCDKYGKENQARISRKRKSPDAE